MLHSESLATGLLHTRELDALDPTLAMRPVELDASMAPLLFVVVDTEEEFDWSAPFSRTNTSVEAIGALEMFQRRMDRFQMKPTYVVDYPVATIPSAYSVVRGLSESGRATIGAHLHPWVTPPFVEDVNTRNSYACNLGASVEEAKLRELTEAIHDNVGVRPVIYKAGRYGFGLSTVSVLERLSFLIDTSINPLMDFRSGHGPSFEAFDARPFMFGPNHRLLEIPCTHGFAGIARRFGRTLHRWSAMEALRPLRPTGLLRRAGVLDKIMLSPEASSVEDLQAVTLALLRDGVRTFTLSFHSPSLEPGHTPYVRSGEDLRRFLNVIDFYIEFFIGSLGGVAGTLEEFRASLLPGGSVA